jgi:hypothetical protein
MVEYCITKNECKLVLTAKGGFEASRAVGGPCGYKPKLFKTRKGAERWVAERSFKPGEIIIAVW